MMEDTRSHANPNLGRSIPPHGIASMVHDSCHTCDSWSPVILPMNLKIVPLLCNKLCVLRFVGAVRVDRRGDLILCNNSFKMSHRSAGLIRPWPNSF